MTAKRSKPQPIRAPRHLKSATRKWVRQVADAYVLEQHHIRLLILAAEAWDRGVQAREALAKSGLTFTDRYGSPRTRPEVAIERDSRLAFARLVRELALDIESPPESRPPRTGGQRW